MLLNDYRFINPAESSGLITENVNTLRKIENELRIIFNKYKITETLVPSFEYLELYKQVYQNFDEDKVFKYIGNDGKIIALRWDYTIPIAKYYCLQNTSKEARFSYFGKVFRNEKKYKGRNSEEYQAGIELINIRPNADELCLKILQETLNSFKLENLKLELGSAKIFNRICELTKDDQNIKEILSKKNISEMKKYINDKKINNRLSNFLLKLPRLCGNIEMLNDIINEVSDKVILEALQELKNIYEMIPNKDYIIFDLSMCPAMEYYTGVMFKVYSPNAPEALVCGGRYDSLYEKFGEKAEAIGMSYYFSNIIKAIESGVQIK